MPRPAPSRLLVPALLVLLLALFAAVPQAGATGTGVIAGSAFKDTNRNGVRDSGEAVLAGERIYVSDGSSTVNVLTDAAGAYRFSGLTPGRYTVRYGYPDWWELWQNWAPSTHAGEVPEAQIDLADAAVVDFGWRPIVRSATEGAPISSYVGSSGLRVESYNDVVPARRIHDAVMATTLHGAETAYTTIRFDLRATNSCAASVGGDGSGYSSFRANCYISYLGWLDSGDDGLVHEYGHAWSLYHAYIVQQDGELTGYLEARGLTGDSRLYSSSTWNPRELIAEDYRQLFGTANAAAHPQDNEQIPPAADVTGLREFLSGPFMQAPVAPAPVATPALHVSALAGTAAKVGKRWRATATTTIRDGAGAAVAGAAVAVRWNDVRGGSGQLSCTTDTAGTCSVSVDPAAKVDAVTFSVASVTKSGHTYAADQDTAPASVTVSRPR